MINGCTEKEKLHQIASKTADYEVKLVFLQNLVFHRGLFLYPYYIDMIYGDSRDFIVCNYWPQGNVNGRRPYEAEGDGCSGGTSIEAELRKLEMRKKITPTSSNGKRKI